MLKFISISLFASILAACSTLPTPAMAGEEGSSSHPDAMLYDKSADAQADVATTLNTARETGKHAIIVMGANWCHDSRALAGWFETPRFQTMLNDNFEVAYVDVGKKNRNIDIAQSFGLPNIVGTPTIVITDVNGDVLNLDTAPTWRNAASRSEDDIFAYFEGYAPKG